MGSRILALICVISAGCGGGFHTGLPTPSIPELPRAANAKADTSLVEITIQPRTVVATSTGTAPLQPGPVDDDDDIRFAESANPLQLRDVDFEEVELNGETVVPVYPHPPTWQEPEYDTASIMRKVVGTYMKKLQRCFDAVADGRENPGKLALSIEIGPTGRVTEARATGLTPPMATCAEQRAAQWRFAAPYDGDGEPTSITVTLSLQIVK